MQNASATITALNDPAANDQSLASVLLESAAKILKPLVRLWITHGVTYQMASELLKRVYVDAAREHFVDKDTSDTRLSLLTGINRKEIRRLSQKDEPQVNPDGITTLAGAIHTMWRTSQNYLDSKGSPKRLPRRAIGDDVSFDALVRSITTDYRPSALVHELTRLGMIEIVPATDNLCEQVCLKPESFLPRRNVIDSLMPLTKSLYDHTAAATANVIADDPIYLERYLFADELSPESVEILHQRSRLLWKLVNDDLIALATKCEVDDSKFSKNKDSFVSTNNSRIGVGMYFYSEVAEVRGAI